MKKFLIQVVATSTLAYIAGAFLPWWSVVVVSFLIASLVNAKPQISFLAGLLALGLLWYGMAVNIHNSTQGILSDKMAVIMGIASSGSQLAIITSILGAILGGLGALTGVYFRKIFTD